jgi:hypothetical protein
VRPEIFRELVDTMHKAPSILAAEEDMVRAKKAHRDCPLTDPCECGLLQAAGAFYVTVAERARAVHMERVYEQLLDQWAAVAVAHAADVDIVDLAWRMYSTAVTYRLLAS